MKRTLTLISLLTTSVLPGCSGNDDGSVGGAGVPSQAGSVAQTMGGSSLTSAGGNNSFGGSASMGGASSKGGAPATGGVQNSGGTPSNGGVPNSVGGQSSGGQQSTGGAKASGGNTSSGGSTATGGRVGTGGRSSTGGKSSGGSTTGGNATGGMQTGGTSTGGKATGGASTGGASTGGAATTGGASGSGNTGACSVTFTGATGDEPGGIIPVCCAPTATETTSIDQVFSLLNAHRAANGLSALAYDDGLEITIQGHCLHMEQHEFFAHNAPEASVADPGTRIKACNPGITLRAWAENIAQGQRSPSAVMTAWTNSSGHNANMLSASVTRVGIGFVASGNTWGQVFAR